MNRVMCTRHLSSDMDKVATLVLIRHGQSTWNADPTFTGWCDAPLTKQGLVEASEAGRLLHSRGFTHFDRSFTSTLQRAVITCELVLDEATGSSTSTTIEKAWQLNERHYGSLQGLKKNDPALMKQYSAKEMKSWRRDFFAAPPPMDKNHKHYAPPPAPLTESLSDCQDRVLKYWNDTILPSMVPGSIVLIAAHSNTLRALVSYLDQVELDKIPNIHIPNSVPCTYHFDESGAVVSPVLNSAAGSTRGHWMFSPENRARLKSNLGGSSGSFVRAIFECWDVNGDKVLSKQEIADGLRDIMGENDTTFAAMAGKILEEVDVNGSDTLDLEEFDTLAVKAFKKFLPDLIE